jgi:hypothetical protein
MRNREVNVGNRLATLVSRSVFAGLVAWFIATVPLPTIAPNTWFAYIKVPIVIFILICYLGKLFFDTFFFDHYKP